MSDLTSRTYILTNAMSGTAMEVWLRQEHNRTVKGNRFSGDANQQWKFIAHGDGTFAIQSMLRGPDGSRLFLCPSDAGIRQCSPLVVGPHAVGWTVEDTDRGLVIRWPKTDLVVDLDEGRGSPHTAINLCRRTEDLRWRRCQLWPYTRCSSGTSGEVSGSQSDASGADCVMDGSLTDVPTQAGSNTGSIGIAMQTTAWAPSCGPYILRNVAGKTRLDVHVGDKSTRCYSDEHREPNRQWDLVPSGDGYAIRSPFKGDDGRELYLSVQGPAVKGALIAARPQPVTWHVQCVYPNDTETSCLQPIRMLWPQSHLVVSLGFSWKKWEQRRWHTR